MRNRKGTRKKQVLRGLIQSMACLRENCFSKLPPLLLPGRATGRGPPSAVVHDAANPSRAGQGGYSCQPLSGNIPLH
ncbi:hypothetical protein HMPREF1326_01575 [Akkermansia sp. KLE1605]|nr:hypothetical protein HMPREF1326_01575 [Akkermansia sp. KLE1605]